MRLAGASVHNRSVLDALLRVHSLVCREQDSLAASLGNNVRTATPVLQVGFRVWGVSAVWFGLTGNNGRTATPMLLVGCWGHACGRHPLTLWLADLLCPPPPGPPSHQ